VQEHTRTITHRTTWASLKVIAADDEAVGGKKASGILVDELWLFGKRPNAENMLREATGGLASRPEGFVIYLSTQSDEPPAGVFRQKLNYARDVRDGVVKDNRFLPVLYEFPPAMVEDKSYRDPKLFYVTNPNLGSSVDREFLEREFRKAERAGEESMCGFVAKHLNVEIGLALRSDRWVGADFWESSGIERLELAELLDRSDVVTVGIDGGGLEDMLGFAVIGREIDTGRWLLWSHAWIHPIVLERRKEQAERFRDFERDGDLTIVKDIGEDVEQVAQYVRQIEDSELLDKVGVDQAGIGAILDAVVDQEIAHDRIVGIPQGWRLVGAIKTAERKLAEKALVHGRQPLMSWCVGNARVEPRGNAVLITKQAAGYAKIDPLMATFDAVALMAMNPKPRKKQYQTFFV
jgi:phage terminase large subunit-like protein